MIAKKDIFSFRWNCQKKALSQMVFATSLQHLLLSYLASTLHLLLLLLVHHIIEIGTNRKSTCIRLAHLIIDHQTQFFNSKIEFAQS